MKATTYRPHCKKPCNECPFRRIAMPGWLGSNTPQSFIIDISYERPLPCHTSINYEDPRWKRQWERGEIGNICAGSLILMRNMSKLPRDPNFPRLPADHKLVFSNPHEFIEHHEAAKIRSWELGPDAEREAR